MEIKKRENIGWIDLLRVIACFLVVLSHSCDAFIAQFSNNHGAFLTGTLIGSSVRACVPLFVMMTGVLMFPVRYNMTDFYKKRIGRIIVPLILCLFVKRVPARCSGSGSWRISPRLRCSIKCIPLFSISITTLPRCGIFICWWDSIW